MDKPTHIIQNPLFREAINRVVEKRIYKTDDDYLMVIDGYTGSGKSTFASQVVFHVSERMKSEYDINDLSIEAEEFINLLSKKQFCVVWLDEGGTALFSRDSMKKLNIGIAKAFFMLRAQHLFIVICIPSFYFLDQLLRATRVNCLTHCYENRGEKGYFVAYNRRQVMWLNNTRAKYKDYDTRRCQGSKYSIKGKFSDYNPYNPKYLQISIKKKQDYLKKIAEPKQEKTENRYTERDKAIVSMVDSGLSCRQVGNLMGISGARVSQIVKMLSSVNT